MKAPGQLIYSYVFTLFICGLFNDAVSGSGYTTSNDKKVYK